jgi:SAM-dependent MidA family methyltransferase
MPASDYFTSVDLHPAFGHLVGRATARLLEKAGEGHEDPLWIVELGPGRGLLARDVLHALKLEHPTLLSRVRYLLVEPNLGWAAIQQRNLLREFAGVVRWVRSLGAQLPLRRLKGVVICNEVLDALPFHVVEGAEEGVREVFVAVARDGSLREASGPVSDKRLAETLQAEGVSLTRGQRGEVSLAAQDLSSEIGRALRRGGTILVDYGDEAQGLYDAVRRPQGTLRCYFRHRLYDEPLRRLGRQDITAHVDFTAVRRALEVGGLHIERLESQSDFLAREGLAAFVEKLDADAPRLARDVYVRHRRALMALADRKGLGGNRVLTASRG